MTATELILITNMGFLVVILIGLLWVILKKQSGSNDEYKGRNQQEILSKIENLKSEFKLELEKQNLQSKTDIEKTFNYFREAVSTKLNKDLEHMNEKVETRLKTGFESSDKLFSSVVEKLAIINTTQSNIEQLSTHVVDLKTYLSDKKSRGLYGEVQLYHILDNVFGQNNQNLFGKQHKLSNGYVVDALIFGNNLSPNIPVDSKFSLENY